MCVFRYFDTHFPVDDVEVWMERFGISRNPVRAVLSEGQSRVCASIREAISQSTMKNPVVELHGMLKADDFGLYPCVLVDLDLNEACFYRSCCESEKKVCEHCYDVACKWALSLQTMISQTTDIDKCNITCVFSGRRGLHLWVKPLLPMSKIDRDAFYKKISDMHTIEQNTYVMYSFLVSVFGKILCDASRKFLGESDQRIWKTFDDLFQNFHRHRLSFKPSDTTYLATAQYMYESIFCLNYDKNVSKSKSHNGRLPWSLHRGAFCRIAFPIDNPARGRLPHSVCDIEQIHKLKAFFLK
jgi:hypothetical protein